MEDGKGWLFAFIMLVSFLVGSAGYMMFREWWAVGVGVLLGLIFSIHIAYNYFMPVFHSYAYEAPSLSEQPAMTAERVTLVIKVPGLPDKLIHGLSRDELRAIGECVTSGGQYAFTVQRFKDHFRSTDVDGYSLYDRSVRWMKDCGALVPNAKGGNDVTEHVGRYVFDAMRDGDWDVIGECESPPYPEL